MPELPFKRMSRADDMFRARRNRVISRRAVGNTLKSTGLMMYIDTSNTMTDRVMFVLISRSSKKPAEA